LANGVSSRARVVRPRVIISSPYSSLHNKADVVTSEDATTSSSQVVQKAPEQLTQKQRQNARRNQLAKAAKADAEAERLAKLAERKRVMERERIIEQSRRGASRATVDSRGKLVYD
jgi:hypothetical protein